MNSELPEDTFDFHNLGILSAYEIETRAAHFLEDSYIKGLSCVLIITGSGKNSKGAPVVKPVVRNVLEQNKYVDSFKIAGFLRGGDGAFLVYLKDADVV